MPKRPRSARSYAADATAEGRVNGRPSVRPPVGMERAFLLSHIRIEWAIERAAVNAPRSVPEPWSLDMTRRQLAFSMALGALMWTAILMTATRLRPRLRRLATRLTGRRSPMRKG